MMKLIPAALLATTALVAPAQGTDLGEVMGSFIVDPQTPEVLDAKCDRYLTAIDELRHAIVTSNQPATIDNALVPYDQLQGLLIAGSGEFTLYQQVMLKRELREAGGKCSVRLSSLSSEIALSRPIYERIVAIDSSATDAETQGYLAAAIAAFDRSGVSLDDEERARVQTINDELGELSVTLARNIAEDVRTIAATPEELAGLPQDFIDSKEVGEDGLITLTTAYTDYQPVMAYAQSDALRERFYKEYSLRAWPANDAVLARIFNLRAELASILGRENYAALALEDKMLNSPERVEQLMADAAEAARPSAQRDYARMVAVLQTIDPEAGALKVWQSAYVSNIAQQTLFDYDRQEARRYFAYNNVRDGVLELTEDLFGVEIRQWDTAVWHPDVEAYEMVDDGKVIGRFYFDNHPRPGKYTHANMIPIYPGTPGTDEVPVGALVQNLPKGDHRTGLMEHGQVETLLHEFGHMIHGMFSGTQRWYGNNFLRIEWDAIEAPSQMLENWVYDYDTLATFAVDAQGSTIPRELVEKMNTVRHFNQGLDEMAQLGLTNVSLRFHTEPVPDDLGAATRAWRNQYSLVTIPDGDQMQAAFSHLDGYSAFYHSYLWSRVVGADLFTRFKNEGLRNSGTANDYRRMVLEPGASIPAQKMIENFLGRPITLDAFRTDLETDAK